MSKNSIGSGKINVTFDMNEKSTKLVVDIDLKLPTEYDECMQLRKNKFET